MKHVLGIAFPHPEAGGPLAVERELQFLRLSYAVHRLSRTGQDAAGYFVVLRQELRDSVLRFKAAYDVDDRVHVVFAGLLVSEVTQLAEAVEAARKAGDAASAAGAGRAVALNALRREILAHEPGAAESTSEASGPFGLPWDYYGTDSQ